MFENSGPLWVWTSFLVLAGDESFRELRCEPVGRSPACSVNTSAILLRPGPTITLPWDLLIALLVASNLRLSEEVSSNRAHSQQGPAPPQAPPFKTSQLSVSDL